MVANDVPSEQFAQEGSRSPHTVPSGQVFTTFFLSHDDNPIYINARLIAQRVSIATESRILSAKLAQSWETIAEVPSETAEAALSFTIQYECSKPGSSQIQVKMRLFHINPNNEKFVKEISFGYKKACGASENSTTGSANPGFSIGTTQDSFDVLEDGIAKLPFSLGATGDLGYTVPANVHKMDFWITGPGIVLNTPFVYVRNQEVLQAQGVGIDEARPLQKTPIVYTVRFLCSTVGQSTITIVFSARTPNFRRTFFTFKKTCDPNQTVAADVPASGTVGRGFSVAAKWGGETYDIISNGAVHELFKATAEVKAEKGVNRPVIPADTAEVVFTVQLIERNIALRLPWVQSFPFDTAERINKPRIVTDRKKFHESSPQQPGEFTVAFGCKDVGTSNNVISFRVGGEQVTFVVRKECGEGDVGSAKAEAPESLFKITGLNIGTHKLGMDVLKDGIPTPEFDWDTASQKVFVVEEKDAFFNLFIWRNKTTAGQVMRLGTPELSASTEISEPQIVGSGSDGDALDSAHLSSFISINFHCMKQGTTQFNLVIPFVPYASNGAALPAAPAAAPASTAGRKLLQAEEAVEVEEDAPKPKPKPKRTRSRAKKIVEEAAAEEPVQEKAVVADADAEVEADAEEVPKKTTVKASSKKSSILQRSKTKSGAKKVVAEEVAEEVPEEAGEVEEEQEAPPPPPPKKKTIKKRYKEAPVQPPTEPYREVPIRLTFVKKCPAPNGALQKGLGGIFIPGLTVCTQKKCADDSYVVYNGFPLTAYFGQRAIKDKLWKPIPEVQESTDLYISYNKVEETDSGNDVVEFDAPMLIKDSAIAQPELSGEASEGGRLAQDGEELELGITYNCKFQGLVAVTVTLPIVPHGAITFTFPKMCLGETKSVGVRMHGLRIGTQSGEADVVLNGFTQEEYQPFFASEVANRKRIYQDKTTFFISQVDGRPVKMLEPTVFAHRGVANPYISHSMHIKKARTEAEDLDVVVVGKEEQQFEVIYNCIFGDETPITVSFPLIPKGRVSFTWIKVCGQKNEDDVLFSGLNEAEIEQWSLGDAEGEVGEQDAETWDAWDELRFMPDLEETSEKDGEVAIGYVDIGTASGLNDVASSGVADPSYSLPLPDSDVQTVTIGRGENLATYYIHVPEGFQEIGTPVVRTLRGSDGQDIVLPKLTGTAMEGGELRADEESATLTVDFNCQSPGVTPVLISVPLRPPNLGSVSFRVVKICGGFDKKESFAFTANTVLGLLALIVVVAGVVMALIYRSSGETKYSRVMQLDVTPDKAS